MGDPPLDEYSDPNLRFLHGSARLAVASRAMIRRAAVAVAVVLLVAGCSASLAGHPQLAGQSSAPRSLSSASSAAQSGPASSASVTPSSAAASTGTPASSAPGSSTTTTSAAVTTGVDALAGSYTMIGDVGGATVKTGATITLTLAADGSLTFHAVQPGQTVDDTGSWSISGSTMTISFSEQDLSGTGRYGFDGSTLTIPVKFFTQGKGSSRWTRTGTGPAGSGGTSGTATTPGGQGATDDWSMWDLSVDAGANGYHTYQDALDGGADQKSAVRKALSAVKAMPDVASAQLSANGYNIAITYTDGTTDEVVTEHLMSSAEVSEQPPGLRRGTGVLPAVADGDGCAVLPQAAAGFKSGLAEPTREGIDPAGGYGVTVYQPTSQPTPLTSADSPPQDERRALLVSPQYDVTPPQDPHLPADKQEQSIHNDIGHDDIGCIKASLTKAGYGVDTVLGSNDDEDLINTGEMALVHMTDDLLDHTYGVFYFAGHGFTLGPKGELHGLEFGPIDLTDPVVHEVLGDENPTNDKPELRHRLAQAIADEAGLNWDPDNPSINVIVSDEGWPVLVVYPQYFTQVRAQGASFSHSLVWINACSSAVSYSNGSLPAAFHAAAFVGWANTMWGTLISDIAEEAFDDMIDKVRTVRAAAEWAEIHEVWEQLGEPSPDPKIDPKIVDPHSIVALGKNLTPYPTIDEQTAVFVYYMRNAPSSVDADLATNATFVKTCYDDYWKKGKQAGVVGPSCQQMQAGSVPKAADVDDALAEVGAPGAPAEPFGRWTLSD